MVEADVVRWPWWMAPARLIGRFRPGLLAAARADLVVIDRMPRLINAAVIPMTVIGLAAAFAALHAFSTGFEPAVPINWLRFHMDNIYTELPLFIIAAGMIGAASPAAGVLFVLSFGAFDIAASAMHPEELRFWALRPFPIAGRLVAYWLLWLLAVEIPVIGRVLASTLGRVSGSRLALGALSGVAGVALVFIWTQATPVLLRPVFLWSDIGGPYAEAAVPLQQAPMVFALVIGATAAVVALLRGPGQLLHPLPPRPPTQRREGVAALAMAVARRLVVAALLTICLGGLILTALDAVVLFAALAGAGPLARWIAPRTPIGVIGERLPVIVRLALAIVLVYGVALLLVQAPALRAVSEYFSLIAVFAVGLFIVELVVARGSVRRAGQPSLARGALVGALSGLAIVASGFVAPEVALADNLIGFGDTFYVPAMALFASVALPLLVALVLVNAISPPPPEPPLLVDAPPSSYPDKVDAAPPPDPDKPILLPPPWEYSADPPPWPTDTSQPADSSRDRGAGEDGPEYHLGDGDH